MFGMDYIILTKNWSVFYNSQMLRAQTFKNTIVMLRIEFDGSFC